MSEGIDEFDEPEELLGGGRPLPRWVRVAGVVLLVAVVGVLGFRALARGSGSHPAALSASSPSSPGTSHSPQIAPPLFRQPGGPRILPAWPTAHGACGDQPQLALVSGQRRAHGTGLTVLEGGARVLRVDLDTGTRTAVRTPALGRGAYVDQFGGDTAGVYGCRTARTTTFTLGSQSGAVSYPDTVDVFQDGQRTYLLREATSHHPLPILSTPGRAALQLPRHFDVTGVTDGVLVGAGLVHGHYMGMLLDARTGRVRAQLPGQLPLAVGGGKVISEIGCDLSVPGPCTLQSTAVSDDATRSYHLLQSPSGLPGVVSPDGRAFAFTIERARADRKYSMGYPLPPADIAWLHLDTGRLDVVPGVELPGKVGLSLAFAPHSDWLVAALDAGKLTRLLAWRPGLTHAEEAAPIIAAAIYRPGLEVVAG